MIGITFAVSSESSELVRHLLAQQRRDNLIFGKLNGRDVAIVHTGVGARNCNERLEALIHKTRPKFVISAGFAGAVTNELRVGDLILAENFSDSTLLADAGRILASSRAHRAKLFTSPSVIDSISERNEIARNSSAGAVDMETGAIFAVCKAHGIPLLSLRAISDSPREPFPAPAPVLFDIDLQRTSYGRLASYILRHPASVPRLFQFSRKISSVRKKLTDALVALLREI